MNLHYLKKRTNQIYNREYPVQSNGSAKSFFHSAFDEIYTIDATLQLMDLVYDQIT